MVMVTTKNDGLWREIKIDEFFLQNAMMMR